MASCMVFISEQIFMQAAWSSKTMKTCGSSALIPSKQFNRSGGIMSITGFARRAERLVDDHVHAQIRSAAGANHMSTLEWVDATEEAVIFLNGPEISRLRESPSHGSQSGPEASCLHTPKITHPCLRPPQGVSTLRDLVNRPLR